MMEKRTIPVLFLLITMSLPFTFITYLQAKQQVVRKQMLRKLERQQLITIEVNKADVTWIDPGKECLVRDEMFDVKEVLQKGDVLILKGLFDHKEKELKRMMARHGKPISETRSLNQLYFFLSLISVHHLNNSIINPPPPFAIIFFPEQPSLYTAPIFDLPHPPPDRRS
jgi:hypothetical protein